VHLRTQPSNCLTDILGGKYPFGLHITNSNKHVVLKPLARTEKTNSPNGVSNDS
jgi:hypothetical protein